VVTSRWRPMVPIQMSASADWDQRGVDTMNILISWIWNIRRQDFISENQMFRRCGLWLSLKVMMEGC